MKEVLIEGEGLNKQVGSEWIGRGGGSFVAIHLRNVSEGNETSEIINK